MPSVDYSYQISTTCSGKINVDVLAYEIRTSEITKNLHYIFVDEDTDTITIWFRENLSSSDEDILLNLLRSHSGKPIGMPLTLSGIYPDYTKTLIIDNEGAGIGVSPESPLHVATIAIPEPHALFSESHTGVLDDSQIPSIIARYTTLASGYLNTLYYTEDEVDFKLIHLYAGASTSGITYNGGVSVTVSGCVGSFFTSHDMHSNIVTLPVSGNTFNLVPNVTNYIVANYNNGTPILQHTLDVDIIDEALIIPVYTLNVINNVLHVLDWSQAHSGLPNRIHARLVRTNRFVREKGLEVATNNRYLLVSSGVVWYGVERNVLYSYDSSVVPMDVFYHVNGVITTSETNVLENKFYDDGENLVEAANGDYLNCWVFRYINSVGDTRCAFVLGGDAFNSLRAAEIEYLPSNIPEVLKRHAIFLARITYKYNEPSPASIGWAFSYRFPGEATEAHDELSGLRGGSYGDYYHLPQYHYNNIVGGNPIFNSVSGTHYGNGFYLTGIDHGNLVGLGDDDHPQYLNALRGDLRYYTESEVDTISGTIASQIVKHHGDLTGLSNDDHPQYHTDARGDIRYYTKSQIDAISGTLNTKITNTSGTLQFYIDGKSDLGHIHDDRYYTESEINTISGVITSKIITDHGDLTGLLDDDHPQYHNDLRGDARYYTQTQLNNGQLDNRYYTETEVNTISGHLQSDIDTRLPIAGGSIAGDLTVVGNLIVSGTQFVTNTEIISTSGNIIYLNNGEVGPGVSAGVAGIQIDRGSLDDYLLVFDESTDAFRVGISGSLQAVATREDSPTNGYVAYWNSSAYRFDTTGSMLYTDIASKYYVDTVSGVLTTEIITLSGSLQTKIDGKSDLGHIHDDRYYTEVELNNGQLDNRYYTETEVDAISGSITAQLHNRSHSITSTADHTAGNWKLFYSNGIGQVQELSLGISGSLLTSRGESTAPVWGEVNLNTIPLASLQVRRTSDYAVSTSWESITFDSVDIQSNNNVLLRDNIDTAKILINEDGLYFISYVVKFNPPNDISSNRITAETRLYKNNSTVISGSSSYLHFYEYETHEIPWACVVNFQAGDYFYLQARKSLSDVLYARADIVLIVNRLQGYKGEKGEKGDPGSGTSIIVYDNGATVSGSPFDVLNFKNFTISGTSTSGVVDITVPVFTPTGPSGSVQFNSGSGFAGDAGLTYSPALNKLTISGSSQTTRLVLGGEDDNNNAALYIQVDGDSQSEGMRTYFKRSGTGYSGWIIYHYDGSTSNIRLIDEDDDPPYIAFQTIYNGTYSNPQYDNRFGSRGPYAGVTTGFKWEVNGTTIAEMDSQFLAPPKGTTAQRPAAPIAGYVRYNTTFSGLEYYDGNSWQPQVFGTYFYESSSEADSSTTSTSWSTKTSITTEVLPAGKYRVGWSYNIRASNTTNSPQVRVLLNGTNTVHNYLYEMKDSSANEEDAVGGFYYHSISTPSTVTVELQFSSEVAGTATTIRRARLEFWRVS